MRKKALLSEITNELNPKYNILNLILTILLIVLGITLFFRKGFVLTAYIDILFGLIGLLIHFFRHKLELQTKLIFTIGLLFIFSVYSINRGGFMGNGLLALALIVVIAMSYLDPFKSTIVSLIATSVIICFTIAIYLGLYDLKKLPLERYYDPLDWIYQSITFVIFTITAFFTIYTIRKLLLKSIMDLKDLAYHDSLTNLYNRNYFLKAMPSELNIHDQKPAIIALLDILNFRLINSLQGVDQGDLFLKIIGEVMIKNATTDVKVARIGSNEFAIIAIGWQPDDFNAYALNCFNELQQHTESMNALPSQRYIAAYKTFSYSKEAFNEAFSHVSLTVKYAKENGIHGRIRFTHEILAIYEKESFLLGHIPVALEKDEFSVHFQGKWNVEAQQFCGYEALARWTLSDGRAISPAIFIPLINKSAYMSIFSKYLVEKAILDFEEIQACTNHRLSLSINISPLFFLSEGFVDYMKTVVENSTFSNDQIILEITEDVFINDYQLVNERVKSLNASNIRISLDDFGTGYSSLSHLNSLDIQEIKMDRSIVTSIAEGEKPIILMETIASMAKRMNCDLVAEGVETIEQFTRVNALGFNLIQGYYFSVPMNKAQIITKLLEK